MYAIIESDGRQYKVAVGEELEIDYRGLSAGDQVTFDRVLCCGGEAGVRIGQPILEGAKVTADVVGTCQGTKLVIQKFKRRKNYRRKRGHRQLYTKVRVSNIETPQPAMKRRKKSDAEDESA